MTPPRQPRRRLVFARAVAVAALNTLHREPELRAAPAITPAAVAAAEPVQPLAAVAELAASAAAAAAARPHLGQAPAAMAVMAALAPAAAAVVSVAPMARLARVEPTLEVLLATLEAEEPVSAVRSLVMLEP